MTRFPVFKVQDLAYFSVEFYQPRTRGRGQRVWGFKEVTQLAQSGIGDGAIHFYALSADQAGIYYTIYTRHLDIIVIDRKTRDIPEKYKKPTRSLSDVTKCAPITEYARM